MISHTENILATPSQENWSHRWLEVLKGQVNLHSGIAGSLGHKRKDGRFGFGDAISKEIIEHLSANLAPRLPDRPARTRRPSVRTPAPLPGPVKTSFARLSQ
jgi:hypothetical protein